MDIKLLASNIGYRLLGWVNFVGYLLDYWFRWENLRDIQKNRIVHSMYIWLFIVPITAKFLAKVEHTATLKIFEHFFVVDLALPFSWQALFFAALCFVVGNIIFLFGAPELVKEYRNFQEFIDSGKAKKQLENYMDATIENRKEYIERIRKLAGIDSKVDKTSEIQSLFWDVYTDLNFSKRLIRWICSAIYGFGFLLFADVVQKNIFWVTDSMDLENFKNQLFFAPVIDYVIKHL